MSEGIKWERSGVRKNRYRTRVGEKKIVIERVGREWVLFEDRKRMAGAQHPAILSAIADEHYTGGLPWQQALAIVDAKIAATQAARAIAEKATQK